MAISAEAVKQLRDATGVSMMECKKALEAAEGDLEKARAILQERSAAAVTKKADRELGAGMIASYVHNTGQVGSLVLLSCETDFVSKTPEFSELARDIAMHAAAMRPATIEELLQQPFIKDPQKRVADLVSAAVQKFGERIEVMRLEVVTVA